MKERSFLATLKQRVATKSCNTNKRKIMCCKSQTMGSNKIQKNLAISMKEK